MVGGALPEFPLLQGENEGVDPMAEPEKEEICDVLQHNVKDETLVEYGFKENEFIMAKDSKVPNPTVWQIVTIDMDRQMVTMQQANSIQELEKEDTLGSLLRGFKVTAEPSDKVMRSICVNHRLHGQTCKFRSRHIAYLPTTSPPPPHAYFLRPVFLRGATSSTTYQPHRPHPHTEDPPTTLTILPSYACVYVYLCMYYPKYVCVDRRRYVYMRPRFCAMLSVLLVLSTLWQTPRVPIKQYMYIYILHMYQYVWGRTTRRMYIYIYIYIFVYV